MEHLHTSNEMRVIFNDLIDVIEKLNDKCIKIRIEIGQYEELGEIKYYYNAYAKPNTEKYSELIPFKLDAYESLLSCSISETEVETYCEEFARVRNGDNLRTK